MSIIPLQSGTQEMVAIQDHQVQRIEYQGHPALTTGQLAELLGTKENTLLQNFRQNRGQFSVGDHFVKLEGDDLKAFRDCMSETHSVGPKPRARNFTLWTAKGAITHVKITDSPKAWAIYHDMVAVYFGEKPSLPDRIEAKREMKSRELAAEFKGFVTLAKAFGIEGNQAILSANYAMKKRYGENPKELIGATHLLAENQQNKLTVTEVGKRLNLSAKQTNVRLQDLRLQLGHRDHKNRLYWELTEDGKEYGVYLDTNKQHVDGTPILQIKWLESVLEVLCDQPEDKECVA